MSDPTNENAGATPPETPPAAEGDAQATQAAPASEQPTQETPAAEQQTAVLPPAFAAAPPAPPAGPHTPWYRRTWAIVVGCVAAAAILFFGGMAVGTAVGGHDKGGFRDSHSRFGQGGQSNGQQGWGDNGGGNGMMPQMGQGGQGYGQGVDPDGDNWQGNGQGGQGYGQPQQAPTTAPSVAPSANAQSYNFQ